MARIPDHEIERLKKRSHWSAWSRSPAWSCRGAHCLGACQASGSVIDWVMRWEGVSFRHAVELLRDGIAPTTRPAAAKSAASRPARSTVAKLPSPLERAA